MNLWWKFDDLHQSLEKIANGVCCSRCSLYFGKTEKSCPHCTGVEGAGLEVLLEERINHRRSIGYKMILAAIAILVVSVFMALS